MKNQFNRKSIRLPSYNYLGKHVYLITIRTARSQPLLTDQQFIESHLQILKQAGERYFIDIMAYCYMPNHLHLLACGNQSEADLIAFVKNYKQITGFKYKQLTGVLLWQKSFHDHILRNNENFKDVVRYIINNPVRKNLVNKSKDYPFSGSIVFGDKIFEW